MSMATAEQQIRELLEDGSGFSEVEDRINDAPALTDDERAALWLLAWSYVPTSAQRKAAIGHIRALYALTG